MAQYQRAPLPGGEMSRRFIEFVLATGRQAEICLGRSPNPATGAAEVNVEGARWFIEQLEMIREKTRGNLNSDETRVLGETLERLQ